MKSQIKEIIDSMSLEEKIGQAIICGFYGTTLSKEIKILIQDYHLGNVILFKRNVENPKQLRSLTSSLQSMSSIPLSIAIDQEGGIVTRLTEPFTTFPGNMATAATGEPHNAYLTGLIMAKEMRAVGINWNLSPVVDVNDLPENPGIGVRSYSDDPQIVTVFASEFVKGLHDGKVAACAKHFPGKGHSAKDAHLEMPTVARDREALEKIDLYPYKELMNLGLDSVMPSHVYYPALCEKRDLPATLSKSVMTDLLKGEMKFEGVNVTDDLEMRGITNSLPGSEAAWRSLKNGADVVMICHTFDEQVKTFEKIKDKVLDGTIPVERLDDAVRRVLEMKKNIGLFEGTLTIENEIGSKEFLKVSKEIVKSSITLCRNDTEIVEKIMEGPVMIIYPSSTALIEVEENENQKYSEMERVLKEHSNFPVTSVPVSSKATNDEIDKVVSRIKKFKGKILLCTLNAHIVDEMRNLVNSVVELKAEDTLLIALRNPYDCFIDGVKNSVALYNYSALSQHTFVEMLISGEKFTGKLPLVHWRD